MLRKIALATLLTAIIVAPVTLYAYSAWFPTSPDADMAAKSMLGRSIDLSGLLTTSFITVSVLLTIRFKMLTRSVPYPELRAVHRYFGVLALLAALIHLGILFLRDHQATLSRINLFQHPPAAGVSGLLALTALLLLAVTSRLSAPSRSTRNTTSWWRLRRSRTLRGRHPDLWRVLHLLLALLAAAATAGHIYFLQHMMEATTYRWLFLLMGEGIAAALIFRYVIPMLRSNSAYRVVSVARPASELVTLTLATPEHADIPRFRAGQFAYLRTRKAPICPERPFTISSSAHTPEQVEFTIRVSSSPRAFSRQLAELKPGSKVYLDGPHGTLGQPLTGWPEKTLMPRPGMVGITQGVGITPCLSVLRSLADSSDTRNHSLLLAVRSKNDLLTFRKELSTLSETLQLSVSYAVTNYADAISPHDMINYLPPPEIREAFEYILCGPAFFVTNVYTQLVHMGVPRSKIHTETVLSAGPNPLGPAPTLPAGHPSAPMRKIDEPTLRTYAETGPPPGPLDHPADRVPVRAAGGDGVSVLRR